MKPPVVPAVDLVDGLDQGAWTAAGFTVSQTNIWGDHFDHPPDAVPYRDAGVDPAQAGEWNTAFDGRYAEMAIAGMRAGWTPEETLNVMGVAFGSNAWKVHLTRVPPKTGVIEVAALIAVELARVDLDPEDLIHCLFAGLTLDEITSQQLDGTLDLEAIRLLAALTDADLTADAFTG